MLQTGDLVPHFTVTTFSGESFDYSDIWQRKNLVLVLLPHAESAASTKFVDQLTAQMSDLTGDDSACVITRDSVSGVPSPGDRRCGSMGRDPSPRRGKNCRRSTRS